MDEWWAAARVDAFDTRTRASFPSDLNEDGFTANGANPRSFPNDGQNFPVLTSASGTVVSGSLTSAAGATYLLEFFSSPAPGPGFQARTFIGSRTLALTSAAATPFSATVTAQPAGMRITATATNLTTGDTSELCPFVVTT